MSLWRPLDRAMVVAAGVSVLAACYAVAAWGQGSISSSPQAGFVGSGPGGSRETASRPPVSPTVTVASLRVPAAAWRHFERARSAEQHHRDAEFERESALALELAPGFASMYLLRASVEVNARDYTGAVASTLAARKADPGAMWAGLLLAEAYNGMRHYKDALLVLNAERGPEAESWQAAYERARAEIGIGDADAALLWSAKALGSAPRECIDAHLVRANALLLAGRLGEAVWQLEAYLQTSEPQVHRSEVMALLDAVRSQSATGQANSQAHAAQSQPAPQLASR